MLIDPVAVITVSTQHVLSVYMETVKISAVAYNVRVDMALACP